MRPINDGPMSGAVARSGGSFLDDRIGQGTKHKQAAASLVKLSSIPLDQKHPVLHRFLQILEKSSFIKRISSEGVPQTPQSSLLQHHWECRSPIMELTVRQGKFLRACERSELGD